MADVPLQEHLKWRSSTAGDLVEHDITGAWIWCGPAGPQCRQGFNDDGVFVRSAGLPGSKWIELSEVPYLDEASDEIYVVGVISEETKWLSDMLGTYVPKELRLELEGKPPSAIVDEFSVPLTGGARRSGD